MTNVVSFGLLLSAAVGLANANGEATTLTNKKLAVDQHGCEIDYQDAGGSRDLVKKCKSKSEPFFKLQDTSAPLTESKTYGSPKPEYLATRWATGKSEEVIIFDLKSGKSTPAFRVISDGPSTISFDQKTQRVKIVAMIRSEEPLTTSATTSSATTKTYYWPDK